jgi:hypothetical protein
MTSMRWPQVDSADAARWRAMSGQSMAWIAGRFKRVEPQATARTFVRKLLSGVDRKNCWQSAKQACHALCPPHALHREPPSMSGSHPGVRSQ